MNLFSRLVLPIVVILILFFGCSRKPGEELYNDALQQWKEGNQVRARVLLEKSISRRAGSKENADAYNRLGLLLWEMGEVDEAVDAFRQSERVEAGQYPVLCNLGIALSAQNNFDAAEQTFREAALLHPNDPRPLAFAGIAYLQNQKWNDAARNLSRALARTPDNPRLQTAMALAELNTKGIGAALQRLQNTVREHPDYAPALFNIASLQLSTLNNASEAKQYFELYLEKSSGINRYAALARTRLQAIDESSSKETLPFTPTETRNRKAAETAFQKALIAHRAGKTDEAIREYTTAIEQDDTFERAFYNLGLIYYANKQMALAGKAFDQAVRLNPAFVDARYNAALVNYYHLGNPEQALRELNIILTQQPNYQPAVDLLARIKK